jgi:hypothetical protein
MDLVSVSCRQVTTFPSNICWRVCLFSIVFFFGNFVKNEVGIVLWINIWILYSVTLVLMSAFVPVPCCRFVIYNFYNVEVYSFLLVLVFLELFTWSGVGSCWRLFLHLLRWSSGFCFGSISMLYYIYRFAYVEPPLHPWDEADLVMLYDLSDVLLDLVCHCFIEDFCIDIH